MRRTSRRPRIFGNASASAARTIGPRLADFMTWWWERNGQLDLGVLRSQFPALRPAEIRRAMDAFTGCITGGCSAEEMRAGVTAALARQRPNPSPFRGERIHHPFYDSARWHLEPESSLLGQTRYALYDLASGEPERVAVFEDGPWAERTRRMLEELAPWPSGSPLIERERWEARL